MIDQLQEMPDVADFTALPRWEQFKTLEGQVGETPTWRRYDMGDDTAVYQKMEIFNPSGSHYDRAYLPTIKYLEDYKLISPGDELRDITSGSAGISLALLGQYLGYPVRITVPNELPETRIQPMQAMGAEVVRCGPGYIKAASDFQASEIRGLVRDGWKRIKANDPEMRAIILEKNGSRICYVNHSENLLSPKSFRNIGWEIVKSATRGNITRPPKAVILAMGNWTTIAGISPVIRRALPGTQIIGYEGENTQVHDNYGTTVQGIPLRYKDETLIDAKVIVTNDERDAMDAQINPKQTVECQIGHSSLMGLVVAGQIIRDLPRNTPVVTIAYDQKSRY